MRKKNIRKRVMIFFACFFAVIFGVLGGLEWGVYYAEKSCKRWYADYEAADLSPLFEKSKAELTKEDYALLYAQTGLTELGVNGFWERGNFNRLLNIQKFYLKEHTVTCEKFNVLTYSETVESHGTLANLEDGDILVSTTTHVSGFRIGHSVLVVDAANGSVIEATAEGATTRITNVSIFTDLADFMVLRPKADKETRAAAAKFAKENMTKTVYRAVTGIFIDKYPETCRYTQCAHLAWYSYKQVGVDLIPNVGAIVLPSDFAKSEQLEKVQIFGFDPVRLWGA